MNSRSFTNHMKDKYKENYNQCIIFKYLENNDKNKILKVVKEKKKYITFKGAKIRLNADFSIETMDTGDNGIKSLKVHNQEFYTHKNSYQKGM